MGKNQGHKAMQRSSHGSTGGGDAPGATASSDGMVGHTNTTATTDATLTCSTRNVTRASCVDCAGGRHVPHPRVARCTVSRLECELVPGLELLIRLGTWHN